MPNRYRSAVRPPSRQDRRAEPPPAETPPEPFSTFDGRPVFLRPIRRDDADALRRAFARLTPEQVRLRVFHRMNELSREAAEYLTRTDPDRVVAYVVTDADGEIRGEARMLIDAATDTAEFALAVDPSYVGQGVGRTLMQRLIDDARRRGFYELWGDVLADNHTMLDFVRALGAERSALPGDPGVVRVSFRLAQPAPA